MVISGLSYVQSQNIYVFRLKDKGNQYSIANPNSFLTEISVSRKSRIGITIDASDLPVNDTYINEISKTGMKILTTSRWFNWVVAEGTEHQLNLLVNKKFILSVNQIHKNQIVNENVKPFFRNEYSYLADHKKSVAAINDIYDYGYGRNQIEMLNGIELHNQGYDGKGIIIAVLDAGFEYVDQLDVFDSLFINNQILGTKNFAEPGLNVFEGGISSHGTMVLSTMGGNLPGQLVGTAPKASYWLLRTEYAPTERLIEEYYWVAGAEFADSIGADIINSSLGYTEFNDTTENHTYEDMDGNTTIVTMGADKAAEKGILVINSAGNEGNSPWHYIGAPADGDSVLSVGAVNASGIYAYFSSHGPTYDGRVKPTLVTQGQSAAVANTFGSISYGSGTSFASPIMAGMSACLLQAFPTLSNMEIIEAMVKTASYFDAPTDTCGYGIPDMVNAYNYIKFYGIAETQNKKLLVYPNPLIDNQLTIQLSNKPINALTIKIYNVLGVLVYQNDSANPSEENTITLSGLNLVQGVYLLTVINGSEVFSSKLVKK
jgi:serine protease AprX